MSSIEDTPLVPGLASMALESSTQAAEDFFNIHELRQMMYQLIDPLETKDYIGFLKSCRTIRAEATEVFNGSGNPVAAQEEDNRSAPHSEFASHKQFGGSRIYKSRPLTYFRTGVVALPQSMFVNASYVEYKPSNAIGNDYYSSWCALHDGHYRWNSPSPVDHFPMSSNDMDKLVIKTWADNLPTSARPSKARPLPFNPEAILSYAAHIHDTIVEEEARLCRGSPNREIIPRTITFDWSDMKPPAGAPLRNSVILSPEFSRSSESLPGNWSVEEILGARGLTGMRWTRVSEHLRGGYGGHWCTTCTGNP